MRKRLSAGLDGQFDDGSIDADVRTPSDALLHVVDTDAVLHCPRRVLPFLPNLMKTLACNVFRNLSPRGIMKWKDELSEIRGMKHLES